MDWPKCRLCGEKHKLGGDHVFKKAVEQSEGTQQQTHVAAVPASHKGNQAASRPAASTARFDRVAYQREYMRRYRARKSAGG